MLNGPVTGAAPEHGTAPELTGWLGWLHYRLRPTSHSHGLFPLDLICHVFRRADVFYGLVGSPFVPAKIACFGL